MKKFTVHLTPSECIVIKADQYDLSDGMLKFSRFATPKHGYSLIAGYKFYEEMAVFREWMYFEIEEIPSETD